jgi:hypothetical protein
MKKGIKINVATQQVEEVFINHYTDIYKEIGNGCNLFCCPVEFENGDTLYADDEALLQENVEGCFAMENFRYPIVGNAIILGTDEEGESVNAKTKKEDLHIIFGNKEVAEQYRKSAMLTQPEIYTF